MTATGIRPERSAVPAEVRELVRSDGAAILTGVANLAPPEIDRSIRRRWRMSLSDAQAAVAFAGGGA